MDRRLLVAALTAAALLTVSTSARAEATPTSYWRLSSVGGKEIRCVAATPASTPSRTKATTNGRKRDNTRIAGGGPRFPAPFVADNVWNQFFKSHFFRLQHDYNLTPTLLNHFNAGFSIGQLLGLDPEACLTLGVCSSGHYVRTGESPTLASLETFLANWR